MNTFRRLLVALIITLLGSAIGGSALGASASGGASCRYDAFSSTELGSYVCAPRHVSHTTVVDVTGALDLTSVRNVSGAMTLSFTYDCVGNDCLPNDLDASAKAAHFAFPLARSSMEAPEAAAEHNYDTRSTFTTSAEFVATNTIGEVNTGVNKIYTSVDPVTGEVQYVGRTNDIARRAAEHLRSKGIQIDEVQGLGNLSLNDAKAVEQVLIEANGGPGGGQLLNKINSIAKSNPAYSSAIQRGCAILSTVGKSAMGAGVC